MLFPLITYPYITAILSVDELGQYNFSLSIINYFALIAGLGVSSYAIREGARIRDDKKALSKFASQMLEINLMSMFFRIFAFRYVNYFKDTCTI